MREEKKRFFSVFFAFIFVRLECDALSLMLVLMLRRGDDSGNVVVNVAGVHIQHLKCLPFSKTQKPFMTVRS